MDSNNLKVSSDLCDEAGLAESAQVLRNLADQEQTVYLVVEHFSDYNDETFYLSDEGMPRNLYLSKEDAFAAAESKTGAIFKTINPFAYGYETSEVTDYSDKELSEKISAILGKEFLVPGEDDDARWDFDPMWPKKTTDEQLVEISKLFKLNFFDVIQTKMVVDLDEE